MKRLKIILQSKYFIIISLILVFLFIFFKTKVIKYESIYTNETTISGVVTKITKDEDKLKIVLKAKENIIANFYAVEDVNLSLGDTITISGKLNDPSNNTIPNTFNYKEYLYNNHIYKTFTVENIKIIKENTNIFYKIKSYIIKRCNNNPYLLMFITGAKSLLEENSYNTYKDIGVAHLLAISGMHVSMFILLLNKILFFIPKKKREILIATFLIFYSFVVDFLVSILRVVIFYILGITNLNLTNLKRLYITGLILLLIDPFYIYSISFRYSFITVLGIMLISKYLSKNYLKDILIISFYALLFTMPITINLNYEINLFSLIGNLILIPIVTFFIYPFSLLTFVFNFLEPFYNFFIKIFEMLSSLIGKVSILTITIPKLNIVVIIIYYLILISIIILNKRKLLILVIMILVGNILFYKIDNNFYVTYLDVGQGDSTILIPPYKKDITIIDTGGNIYYDASKNITLYLKSLGISKITNLIITHGDFDHMGNALNLINNIKVENIIFNCGSYNTQELKLLDKKNINYYSCIDNLKINRITLSFLNTELFDNENDNSNVIYLDYQNIKFLFMGDAGIKRENKILNKYNLKNIDFLKVGHHGSNTSSSKFFIESINPKYSIVSVGAHNRYGHPKDEVLDILKKSKIYRTDIDGSVEIKLNKNGYKIRTCPP